MEYSVENSIIGQFYAHVNINITVFWNYWLKHLNIYRGELIEFVQIVLFGLFTQRYTNESECFGWTRLVTLQGCSSTFRPLDIQLSGYISSSELSPLEAAHKPEVDGTEVSCVGFNVGHFMLFWISERLNCDLFLRGMISADFNYVHTLSLQPHLLSFLSWHCC